MSDQDIANWPDALEAWCEANNRSQDDLSAVAEFQAQWLAQGKESPRLTFADNTPNGMVFSKVEDGKVIALTQSQYEA